MSFWVAKGAGLFAAEGFDVQLVVPDAPQQVQAAFERRDAEMAVLPPPVYVTLIANKVPVVLVANLLQNDAINVVVRRSVLVERNLDAKQPLKQRLDGLHDLRVGVAPHPITRMRQLFTTQGLDVDKHTEVVVLHGKEQNKAFHEGEVDVLYAHTPFLERAILHDDAVLLVNQSKGEVPELSNRQIHTLVVQRQLLTNRRELVRSFVRAIGKAEQLIHDSHQLTVEALKRELPDRDPKELDTIVTLYEPAIPKTPAVNAEQIPQAVSLFPAGLPPPSLEGINLTAHVASDLVERPPQPKQARPWSLVLLVGCLIIAGIVMLVPRWKRKIARKPGEQ